MTKCEGRKIGNCQFCGDIEDCAEEQANETFFRVTICVAGFLLGVVVTAGIAFWSVS